MPKRSANLLERDPDTAGRALLHPRQLEACGVIADLITRMRVLHTPKQYYDFQRLLFSHLIHIETEQAQASRNVKRERAGKPVPPPPEATWELERLVLDRIARQLRSVGDAIAWRLHRFDRRVILALSRNEQSGPMYGKAVLDQEINEVQTIWAREEVFALLHDVTNCLRVADVTKFGDDRALLIEVKAKATGPTSRQMMRIQHALDVINGSAPLRNEDGGTSELFVAKQPLRTHLGRLAGAIEMADAEGMSSLRIGMHWVVCCLSLTSANLPAGEAGLEPWAAMRRRALGKADMTGLDQHYLRGVRPDAIGRSAGLAPFSIYPFSPDVCARLTCDLLHYESVMRWDRLAAAFQAVGFRTECPLQDSNDPLEGSSAVLHAVKGERGMTIHGSGVNQILYELVDPKAWAMAANEAFSAWPGPSASGVFTFANERAVWR